MEAANVACIELFLGLPFDISPGGRCLDGSNDNDRTKDTNQIGAPSTRSRRMHQTSGRATYRQAQQGGTNQKMYGRTTGIKKGFKKVEELRLDSPTSAMGQFRAVKGLD
jgi:hypothetical protein